MAALGFTLFDTALGRCGIACGEGGIAGIQLPEAHEAATRARVQRRFPEALPPAGVRRALGGIAALLRGEPSDLAFVALDLTGLPGGLEAGGRDHGGPGLRSDYGPKYYAGFLLDPDGNNVEAVCLR
jgi:hypothetical protein